MDNETKVGILGCRIVYGDGTLQNSSWRFPTLLREWYYFSFDIIRQFFPTISRIKYKGIDYENVSDTDCISGCCMFINKNVVLSIGGLDECFFMYYEDSEFCYRTLKHTDYHVRYYPHYQVIHYHGKSGDTLKAITRSFKSACYYFYKTRGILHTKLFILACMICWHLNLLFIHIFSALIKSNKLSQKILMFRALIAENNALKYMAITERHL
jgi:GT2 family glycosyltransferase